MLSSVVRSALSRYAHVLPTFASTPGRSAHALALKPKEEVEFVERTVAESPEPVGVAHLAVPAASVADHWKTQSEFLRGWRMEMRGNEEALYWPYSPQLSLQY